MEKQSEHWLHKWLQNKKGKEFTQLAFLLFLGILCMLIGQKGIFSQADESPIELQAVEEVQYSDKKALESQMSELLSQVYGAGLVQVMITYQDSGIFQIATENSTEIKQSEGDEVQEKTEKMESTILLTEDVNGATSPFLLQAYEPTIEGVLIVAEGGGNAIVSQNLFLAAQALFDVPAHKIAILQMKS